MAGRARLVATETDLQAFVPLAAAERAVRRRPVLAIWARRPAERSLGGTEAREARAAE
jgi:hypothetical protein